MRMPPLQSALSSPSTPSRSAATHAFTLVEILIATLIFSLILVAMNTTFSAALRLRARTTELVEDAIPIQRALAVIKRDLQCILPPGGTFAGSMTAENGSDPRLSRLEFYTASGSLDNNSCWGDIQKVAYYLQEPEWRNPTNGYDLVRTVTRNLLPSTVEEYETTPLLHDIEGFRFQCHDGSQWIDTWDPDTEEIPLPQAVLVAIQRRQHDLELNRGSRRPDEVWIEMLVPVAIESNTNQTSGASSTNSASTAASASTSSTGGASGSPNTGGGSSTGGPGGGATPSRNR